MRFYEFKQSDTSPLKYRVELSSEEAEKVKDLLYRIIERLNKDEEK